MEIPATRNDNIPEGQMSMRRYRYKMPAVVLLLFLLIVSACEGEATVGSSGRTQPSDANVETVDLPANDTPGQQGNDVPGAGQSAKPQPSMSEWITELTICENDPPPPGAPGAGSSDCMTTFGTRPFSIEKTSVAIDIDRFAIYMRNLYFFVSFDQTAKPELIQQLVNQIEVDGGELTIRKEHADNDYRYKGEVPNVDRPLTLRVGDLPPIQIVPGLPPLTYNLELPESSNPALLLYGQDYGTHLLVPDKTETVVLAFSEPIRTAIASALIEHPDGDPTLIGEWIDDRRLQLNLSGIRTAESGGGTSVQLRRVFAESGAYLADRYSANLHIRKVPQSRWLRYPSGEPALESPYARFYDFILFSPDRKRWIGLVELGGEIGDGIGAAYGVLLEEPGAKPEIIRHFLTMSGVLEKPSTVWAGNDHIAFYDHTGVYLYDIETRKAAKLLDYAEAAGYPNFIAYDEHAQEILLYMQVDRNADEETRDIDLWRFPVNDPNAATVVESYTTTIMENKYFFQQLPILPTRAGIYWGQTLDGKYHTVYETRDGRTWTAEGLPVAQFGDRVYLRSGNEWFIWKPGTAPIAIAVPEDAWVRPFGHYLVWQQSSDHRWKQYNPDTGKAADFPLVTDGTSIPFQPYDALYRASLAP